MSRFLQRTPRVSCYFCQCNILPAPINLKSFLCPHCSCWNRFDENGDIISDDPAMYEQSLNTRSFIRRASPRKDRFLSSFGSTQFCDICQSNQRLVMSLLASYLPPSEEDAEYAKRPATYADYKASIEARYPPVCANCSAAVEDEIRKKDEMARSNVLGRLLTRSKTIDEQRKVTQSLEERRKLERQLFWWKVRGVLYGSTLVLALYVDAVASGIMKPLLAVPRVAYIVWLLLSPFWTYWDPSYAQLCRAQIQGRTVKAHGRNRYIALQVAAWLLRLSSTIFLYPDWGHLIQDGVKLPDAPNVTLKQTFYLYSICVEIAVCCASYFVLRLYEPPSVRLFDSVSKVDTRTSGNQRAATPSSSSVSSSGSMPQRSQLPPQAGNSFQQLSWSPSIVFGKPSLLYDKWVTAGHQQGSAAISGTVDRVDEDDDAMDWTPTVHPQGVQSHTAPNGQSNFYAETRSLRREETGLEMLLSQAKLAEESHDVSMLDAHSRTRVWSWLTPAISVAVAALVVCLAVLLSGRVALDGFMREHLPFTVSRQ